MEDLPKRRLAALREIVEAARLLEAGCQEDDRQAAALLARIELAAIRLEMLERMAEAEPPAFRPPGKVEFPDPLVAYQPTPRGRRQRRAR